MSEFWMRNNQRHLDRKRLQDRVRVVAHYPSNTDCTNPACGWDDISQSGKLINCPVCHGRGKVATWQTYYLRARVNWPGAGVQFSYLAPTSGVELGDVTLTISPHDTDIVERVQNVETAYLVVDDKQVRPTTIQKMGLSQIGEEYQVACHLFTPDRS